MSVYYGSYLFPDPAPAVVVGDEAIYAKGLLDHTAQSIDLIGVITGLNLTQLSQSKEEMVVGLLNAYQTVSGEGLDLPFCKPTEVSFSDSDMTTVLPYSVKFERYDEKSFSEFYGVESPVDQWVYQEEEQRVVSATHTVSANGVKIDGQSALDKAMSFVNSRLAGFENFSTTHPLLTGDFLREKTEEINRMMGTYSVTEKYSLSDSSEKKAGAVITANTQINHQKEGESSITVAGEIIGSILGPPVEESFFTVGDAEDLARQAVLNTNSNYEDTVLGLVARGPNSYKYDHNEESNKINFSFSFENLGENDEIVHNYNVSISANKDDGIVSATINGDIFYNGTELPYDGAIEDLWEWPRFLALREFFNNLNLYAVLYGEYLDFYSAFEAYDGQPFLNLTARSESITENAYAPSISYSFSYDNKRTNTDANLKNLSIQVTDNPPFRKAEPIIGNCSIFFNYNNTLGRRSVASSSAGSKYADCGSVDGLKNEAESYFEAQCITFEEGGSENEDKISYNKSVYYL